LSAVHRFDFELLEQKLKGIKNSFAVPRDRASLAYLRVLPQLPAGIDPHSLPPTINAKLMVAETGEVDSLEIDQALDPQVAQAIRRALNGWLFLPRLKNGSPEQSVMELPLSFGQGSP
jgi:hypothetical protein